MHDREQLYRWLYDQCDPSNVIQISQGEVAKRYGISYQRLSIVMKEYQEMGMITKYGHQFTVAYHPDRIPWDKYLVLRKKYVESQNSTDRVVE